MRLKLLIFCSFVAHIGMSQSIGLSVNQINSTNRKVQGALGIGLYSNVQTKNDRISLLFDLNAASGKSQFNSEGFKTDYQKISLSISVLNSWSISERIDFKLGPGVNFNRMYIQDSGIFFRWVRSGESNNLGINFASNLHFKNVFSLPIHIDLFVVPTLMLEGWHTESVNLEKLEFDGTLKSLDLKFGISYDL